MNVFLLGGTGFVGTHLTRYLIDAGHRVTIMARKPRSTDSDGDNPTFVAGDGMKEGPWQDRVADHDLLINLAGANVFARWTEEYKKLLVESRTLTTRHLVDAVPANRSSEIALLNASGIGLYGHRGDDELDENTPKGNDFLGRLASEWEAEAVKARDKGVRTAIMRLGIVLGRDGGAFPQMILPFRFFVGGPIGNGNQWVPWIHIDDVCRAILFLAENPDANEAFNLCAPEPVRNKDLAAAIGKAMNRPSIVGAPGFAVKLLFGEFGSVVLEGQRAIPAALLRHGFRFTYPTIHGAVRDLVA